LSFIFLFVINYLAIFSLFSFQGAFLIEVTI
jgi:hypothetical protein